MKKHLTILALTLFALISFNACTDDNNGDDSKIYFYYSGQDGEPMSDKLSSINEKFFNSTLKAGFISVAGGEGKYSAKSSDQSIIEDSSIEIDKNYYSNTTTLSFILQKEGTVTITVTDEQGNSARLEVVATILSQKFEIVESELIFNDEVSEATRKGIENDIKANNLNKGNYIALTYDDHYKGSFRVSTTPLTQDIRLGGSFSIEDAENKFSLYLTYNEMKHHYYYSPYDIRPEAKTEILYPPATYFLKEDLTEYYKAKYPSESITEVSYLIILLKK